MRSRLRLAFADGASTSSGRRRRAARKAASSYSTCPRNSSTGPMRAAPRARWPRRARGRPRERDWFTTRRTRSRASSPHAMIGGLSRARRDGRREVDGRRRARHGARERRDGLGRAGVVERTELLAEPARVEVTHEPPHRLDGDGLGRGDGDHGVALEHRVEGARAHARPEINEREVGPARLRDLSRMTQREVGVGPVFARRFEHPHVGDGGLAPLRLGRRRRPRRERPVGPHGAEMRSDAGPLRVRVDVEHALAELREKGREARAEQRRARASLRSAERDHPRGRRAFCHVLRWVEGYITPRVAP